MPFDTCELETLTADCDEINCKCCTKCCFGCDGTMSKLVPQTSPPTLKPTKAPTNLPSSPPTMKPTGCTSSLSADKMCYITGTDDITLSFQNCDAKEFDWIGFFPADLMNFDEKKIMKLNQKKAEYWVGTCGDEFCEDIVGSGTLAIPNTADLESGQYLVLLMNNNGQAGDYISGGKVLINHVCE